MFKNAYFAGGCFWCTESIFQRIRGVSQVIPGYMGGFIKNPDYREVCTGKTGHTETIKITYDKNVVSYPELLEIFFSIHDPTTPNRQGNDIGSQYRSAVFFENQIERIQIIECISLFEKNKIYNDSFVTEINKKLEFYEAEIEHHDYYNQNKSQPYCQSIIRPKIKKFQSLFDKFIVE
jgi:peptide-methionine (S)-S-oxide reductase